MNKKRTLTFFNSFDEMENQLRKDALTLTPIERLQQLRQLINVAYGMHGFDPNNLPKKHCIKTNFKNA